MFYSKKETFRSNGNKMPSRLALGLGEDGEEKYTKSVVERYRRLLVWFLYAGIFAAVIFTPSLPERKPLFEYLQILSYLLVAVATVGRLWCGIYVFGRKSKALCQDGPYSICRNPLYIFTFLGAMGVATASNRIAVVIGFALIYGFYYFLVVKFEEKRLLNLFGREYEDYCARVPRFRPKFRNYCSRERVEVNPHILLRAMIKGMWFFGLLAALEVVKILKGIF